MIHTSSIQNFYEKCLMKFIAHCFRQFVFIQVFDFYGRMLWKIGKKNNHKVVVQTSNIGNASRVLLIVVMRVVC